MTNEWKVGDLAKINLYTKSYVVAVKHLFLKDSLCFVEVMDSNFGFQQLTVHTSTLGRINE